MSVFVLIVNVTVMAVFRTRALAEQCADDHFDRYNWGIEEHEVQE